MPPRTDGPSHRNRWLGTLLLLPLVALAVALVAGWGLARRAGQTGVLIDASGGAGAPSELPFAVGGRSPAGQVLAANSRYLLRDGRPWFPVMGEFHYTRYPADEWERELLKMKAGGIQIVGTYVFWIHHEEIEGQFDWSGDRDLRRFVALCARHGLYAWVRVGPWAHGECRNGGLPDWLLRAGPTRQNAPFYLDRVRRFYGEIGRQVQGLFWKDGGPIVGVQIENEYHEYGPGKGTAHILELKRLAQAAGLLAPFYTLTAWDNTAVPERGLLPVFGGYADGFWYRSTAELSPSPNFFFTPIRCYENVDDDLRSKAPERDKLLAPYPYLTAEMGGGMATAYHRRPRIDVDDTVAMAVTKIGAGVTLYGYYMFHGGTNPEGKLTTLQESQATTYWNDVPLKGYDFQAPLGEFGQMAPSFRDLKALHLFLADFGERIAPLAPFFGQPAPASTEDVATPRVAARLDGRRGFICINNHQRNRSLPARSAFQARLKLVSGPLDVPRKPTTIPADAYTLWPVNLDLDGATLEYATVQPLCRLANPATYVFFAWPGIGPELSLIPEQGVSIEAPQARLTKIGGRVVVDGLTPGTEVALRLAKPGGQSIAVIVLSREQARNLWKARLARRERLVLSAADLYFEGDRVHVSARAPRPLEVAFYPSLDREVAGFQNSGEDGIFARYAAPPADAALDPEVRKVRDAGAAPPVRMGALGVATPPDEAEFTAKAAVWSVRVPAGPKGAPSRRFLRILYKGDVARLYAGKRLVTDDFYKGTPWEIGLWRLSPEELARGLELRIMPLREDAPIYLPAGARPGTTSQGQSVGLESVQLQTEREVVMDLGR
jgi:beta-galactosidase